MPNTLNILFKALKSRCMCDAYTCVHVDVEARSHVRCHMALHLLSETKWTWSLLPCHLLHKYWVFKLTFKYFLY